MAIPISAPIADIISGQTISPSGFIDFSLFARNINDVAKNDVAPNVVESSTLK
jgi:hypothetical protein